MRDSEKGGEKPIEAVEKLRTRKVELERVTQGTTKKEKPQEYQRRLEDFYQAVMENTFFGFTLIDCDYNIVLVNSLMCNYFHKPADELIGKKCFREFEKRKAICPFCPGTKAMATCQPADVETEKVRDDGSRFPARIQAFPTLDSGGAVTGFIEIAEDISERKEAEQELIQQHNLLCLLIDNLPDRVYVKDCKSRFILGNDAVVKYEGFQSERELLGKTDFDLYPKEQAASFYAKEQEVVQKGRPMLNVEEFWIDKQSNEQWLLTTKIPLRGDNGEIIGLVGINRNITERKKAEKAIREERDFAKSIVETAQAIILVLDTQGHIVDFNPYMEEICGYKIEEVAGRDWFGTFLPKRDRERIRELFLKAVHDIQTRGSVNPIVTKEGVEREIEWYDKTLKDSAGNIVGLLCIGRDVTERKKVDKKIYDYQQRLKALSSQLSLIEEHAKRKIVAGLHDNIGQKLVTAKLELQSLMKSGPDSKMSESINSICEEITHIMDDVRSLTFELGNPLLDKIGLTAALEKYITGEIQAKFAIKCELLDEAGAQDMDETVRIILYRSTRELLVNVVKHARAHNIRVRIYQSAGQTSPRRTGNIHICVEDDGVGFDVSRIALLPTKAGGFGLFSIKEQLEYIGGNLQIESMVSHGTKVTISCPLELRPAAGLIRD